jgi:hypothetical protein
MCSGTLSQNTLHNCPGFSNCLESLGLAEMFVRDDLGWRVSPLKPLNAAMPPAITTGVLAPNNGDHLAVNHCGMSATGNPLPNNFSTRKDAESGFSPTTIFGFDPPGAPHRTLHLSQ